MASVFDSVLTAIGVKRQPKAAQSITPTFQPTQKDQVLTAPQYREHIASLYDDRPIKTSRELLRDLFKGDPDVSAAVHGHLTLANTPMTWLVKDPDGQIDPAATLELNKAVTILTRPVDYTQGFQLKFDLPNLCADLRYMLLLRGAIAGELVFDKKLVPNRIQLVDIDTIKWFEKEAGVLKPGQQIPGKSDPVMLDIPSFFVAFHRRDPLDIYPTSSLVSAINIVAARQQVINDLYRIMNVTGFPRISVKVVEEVLLKNAPANVRDQPEELTKWAKDQLTAIAQAWSTVRADEPVVHFDSVEPSMINEKNPGAGLDITSVIEVLNAQNQAALKTMATVIGRGGQGGVNMASVEARIAAMTADELNVPLKQFFDQLLTFLLNANGIPGFVEVHFAPAELRPELELEPQRVLKSTRLLADLSSGIITDEEYTLQMYGRLPNDGAPPLSGTNFMQPQPAGVNTDNVSSNVNGGTVGKSMVSDGAKKTRDNKVKAALDLLDHQTS
jgi:hypothetical protein